MIGSLIECEHDFINCDHPEFVGGRGAIRAVMQDRALRAQGAARAKVGLLACCVEVWVDGGMSVWVCAVC